MQDKQSNSQSTQDEGFKQKLKMASSLQEINTLHLFNNLKNKQVKFKNIRYSFSYLSSRKTTIAYLKKLKNKLSFSNNFYHFAVCLVDIIASSTAFLKAIGNEFEILVAVVVLIASKYRETDPDLPSIGSFEKYLNKPGNFAVSEESLRYFEVMALEALGYNLEYCTILDLISISKEINSLVFPELSNKEFWQGCIDAADLVIEEDKILLKFSSEEITSAILQVIAKDVGVSEKFQMHILNNFELVNSKECFQKVKESFNSNKIYCQQVLNKLATSRGVGTISKQNAEKRNIISYNSTKFEPARIAYTSNLQRDSSRRYTVDPSQVIGNERILSKVNRDNSSISTMISSKKSSIEKGLSSYKRTNENQCYGKEYYSEGKKRYNASEPKFDKVESSYNPSYHSRKISSKLEKSKLDSYYKLQKDLVCLDLQSMKIEKSENFRKKSNF